MVKKVSLAELAIQFVDTGKDEIWKAIPDNDRMRFWSLVKFVEIGRGIQD